MVEFGLNSSDIAKIVSKETDTVNKWLSGTNRMPEASATAITRHLDLPDDFFSMSIKDYCTAAPGPLTDRSVIIKNTNGLQVIVDLDQEQLNRVVHFALDLALGNE